jgi:hypothetical protein
MTALSLIREDLTRNAICKHDDCLATVVATLESVRMPKMLSFADAESDV